MKCCVHPEVSDGLREAPSDRNAPAAREGGRSGGLSGSTLTHGTWRWTQGTAEPFAVSSKPNARIPAPEAG